jgi:hypothetical protein
MVTQISFETYVMKKMSAVRVLKQRGVDEAIKLYPDYTDFILSINGKDLSLVNNLLIQDLRNSKVVH